MAFVKLYKHAGTQYLRSPSTVFEVGDFVQFDGLGAIVPAPGGTGAIGISNVSVQTTDIDFASAVSFANLCESVVNETEYFIPVITGAALASMVGSTFDIDAGDSRGIDVSGAGTDILITAVIDAENVIGKIA